MRVFGTAFATVIATLTQIDLLVSADAVWDLDDLTITYTGASRWLTTDGTWELVIGYDAAIGYNAFALRIDFSNGTNMTLRLDPQRPYQWDTINPVALLNQTVVHLPFMFNAYNGCDLKPLPYH